MRMILKEGRQRKNLTLTCSAGSVRMPSSKGFFPHLSRCLQTAPEDQLHGVFPMCLCAVHFVPHSLIECVVVGEIQAVIYLNAVFDTREIPNKQGLSSVLLRRKPSSFMPVFSFSATLPVEI